MPLERLKEERPAASPFAVLSNPRESVATSCDQLPFSARRTTDSAPNDAATLRVSALELAEK
jgi:hypothetical protein